MQAFWFGTLRGFTGSERSSSNINNNHVDGISLTYEHPIADGVGSNQNCPHQVPGYVGDHYSCLK